jgi:hypothetical protein
LDKQIYTGSCHCRRVRYEVRAALDRATECNCSICSAKGYLHHMIPAEDFELLSGSDDLTIYSFGTHVAQHLFCRHCGISPYYRPRANPKNYMLNLRCVDGLDLAHVTITQFDGRAWESRPDAPYMGVWNK